MPEIPGEIDASQYDPAHFETGSPVEGALPVPSRDSISSWRGRWR